MTADVAMRVCAVIPTFDNPLTIAKVVDDVRPYVAEVLVVDDGSGAEARRAIDELERRGAARVIRRETNGGKGAAVKTGLRAARELGFSHALQIDADGQHDPADIPTFLARAAAQPAAAVLGHPVFDESTPRGRRAAHGLTNFWTRVETGGAAIEDPQCGFRVYPVARAIEAEPKGDHMDFDIEIAVRMARGGTPVINLPVGVRYVPRADGGVSHFNYWRDNALLSWMHFRLFLGFLVRLPLLAARRLR